MASLKVNRTYGRGSSSTTHRSTKKDGDVSSSSKTAASRGSTTNLNSNTFMSPPSSSTDVAKSSPKKDKASSLFDELFSSDDSSTPTPPKKPVLSIDKAKSEKPTSSENKQQPTFRTMRSSTEHFVSARGGNAPKLTRTVLQPQKFYDEPVTQLKCKRSEKEMFTIVKHVKQAHQCHESGETQQMSDDIEYYLSNILSDQKPNVKYLSMCTLAQKCISANFRAHVRAYGYATKLFHALSDSYADPILSLCTSCVFYLMSRDRLSLVIDDDTLNLALKFVDSDERFSTTAATDSVLASEEYLKYKRKIWQILSDWHKLVQNNAAYGQKIVFDVTEDNLSVSFLATESLVYIFLRNKDALLKLAICRLGGLDLLVRNLEKQSNLLPVRCSTSFDGTQLDNLKLIERYLRILEQATQMCPQNQAYLIAYLDARVLKILLKVFDFSQSAISSSYIKEAKKASSDADTFYPFRKVINLLSVCLKVSCNLTHLNDMCCKKLGEMDNFLVNCVHLVISLIPEHIPADDRFDLTTLTLGLLINLIEPCNSNRKILLAATGEEILSSSCFSPIESLAQLFLRHEAAAVAIDEDVDQKIEFCCSQEMNTADSGADVIQQIQETLEAAVSQAGRHMEDCVIASHIALFFGLLLQQNENAAIDIKRYLGNKSFDSMIAMLKKFMDFMRLVNHLSPSSERTMAVALELLEQLN